MDFQSFAYWLQGYSEICGKTPDDKQWAIIQEHLQLCLKKETKFNLNPTYCHFKEPIRYGDCIPSGQIAFPFTFNC